MFTSEPEEGVTAMRFLYQARYVLVWLVISLAASGYLFLQGLQHGWNYPLTGKEGDSHPVFYWLFIALVCSVLAIVLLIALGTGRLKR